MKKGKWFAIIIALLAVVGGAVHIAQPLGYNLLGMFGSYSNWVQLAAGIATVWFGIRHWPKVR